jgi:hypothetical protein
MLEGKQMQLLYRVEELLAFLFLFLAILCHTDCSRLKQEPKPEEEARTNA